MLGPERKRSVELFLNRIDDMSCLLRLNEEERIRKICILTVEQREEEDGPATGNCRLGLHGAGLEGFLSPFLRSQFNCPAVMSFRSMS